MQTKTTINTTNVGELNHLLGKHLRALRRAHRLSQAQLAKKLGITRATLANYESGRAAPPYWLVIQLATYFQTDALLAVLADMPQNKLMQVQPSEPINVSPERK